MRVCVSVYEFANPLTHLLLIIPPETLKPETSLLWKLLEQNLASFTFTCDLRWLPYWGHVTVFSVDVRPNTSRYWLWYTVYVRFSMACLILLMISDMFWLFIFETQSKILSIKFHSRLCFSATFFRPFHPFFFFMFTNYFFSDITYPLDYATRGC